MYRYCMNEGGFYLPDVGAYQSYGLKVVVDKGDTEIFLLAVPDISTDSAFVAFLAETFEREQLEPLHLLDVLEDLLP